MNDISETKRYRTKLKSYLREPAAQLEELVLLIPLLGMDCGADGDFSHDFKSSLEYVGGVPLTYGLIFP